MGLDKVKKGRPPMKANEKKRHIYSIRIDEKLDKEIKKLAKLEKITKTELIRKAVKEYIKKNNI